MEVQYVEMHAYDVQGVGYDAAVADTGRCVEPCAANRMGPYLLGSQHDHIYSLALHYMKSFSR